ncbi:MAG: biotin/lipoyl-binding protein [Lachnospiraceae bacterium]|nr:biotin/lipoyl-binding protein [Lachnospiraceae bacterium]HAP34229.1 acetyl-CoA carboxylase biotin carboxyl carrier protein subunit [Lachnospiraceae bacterium]
MKSYTITVNGTAYDVTVEENGAGAPVAAAPVAAARPAAAAAPAPKKAAGGAGSVKVSSPMQGKILRLNNKPGDAVKKGQAVIVLEAMKMENEIVATQDGTVASIDVAVGDMVDSGQVVFTMN